MNKLFLLGKQPFIVKSRESNALVQRLEQDDFPILFEGLHSCASFMSESLTVRKKYIRAHNVEHHYYEGLSKAERNVFKSRYMQGEARKLEKFEEIMNHASGILSISPLEEDYFKQNYKKVHLIFPFHGNDNIHYNPDRKPYALYHGNLAVSENEKAARFLVNEVFNHCSERLMILGNEPSKRLKKEVDKRSNVILNDSLNSGQITDHIREAQVNILPTFQSTGVKLKLINALYNGGHCIVNTPMIERTGLEKCCEVMDDPARMASVVEELMNLKFEESHVQERKQVLMENLSDELNAERLIEIIFES